MIQKHTGTHKYYQELFSEHGHDAKGAGWKNKEAQWKRFEQLAKIITTADPFSVNDLGCGFGSFYDFLQVNDLPPFQYTGYDILDNMLGQAQSLHESARNASFNKIDNAGELLSADYTIASGIFNLKYEIAAGEWLQYILQTIGQMFDKSQKGIAFNILTAYSDKEFMKDHLYYADPLFLFDHCKKNFSRNVALLHDYDEYDFTILIRK